MPYPTHPTWSPDVACADCAHFGGWPPGHEGRIAWCGKAQQMNSQQERGCAYWRKQPPGWVAPVFDPTPRPDPKASKIRMR